MSHDPFDEQLRSGDPLGQLEGDGLCSSSEAVQEARTSWDSLLVQRAKRRRLAKVTVAVCSLAATLILALSVGFFADRTNESNKVASVGFDEQERPDSVAGSPLDVSQEAVEGVEVPRADDLEPEPHSRHTLERFIAAVNNAGAPGSKDWKQAVAQLSHADPITQRLAVGYVAKVPVYQLRVLAFQLVCDASGEAEKELLAGWLSEGSLRTLAFDRLASTGTTTERMELSKQARSSQERRLLCVHVASSADPSAVDALLRFCQDARWRAAVSSSLHRIHASHIRPLVLRLRQRDRSIRTSAAFLLASIPGDSVDKTVASMIREKRFLQPAYMTLLARQTPNARSLLASVLQQPDLVPAFYSAQLNFQSFTRPLQQWLSDSQGKKHDTSKYQSVGLPLVLRHRIRSGSTLG